MALLKVSNIIFDDKAVVGLEQQEDGVLEIALSGGAKYLLKGDEAARIWSRFDQLAQDLMVDQTGSGFHVSNAQWG